MENFVPDISNFSATSVAGATPGADTCAGGSAVAGASCAAASHAENTALQSSAMAKRNCLVPLIFPANQLPSQHLNLSWIASEIQYCILKRRGEQKPPGKNAYVRSSRRGKIPD